MNINKHILYLERLTNKRVILVEKETFFVPQDLKGRKEKYLQSIYRLLNQEVIEGDLILKDLPIKDLGRVKRVNGNVEIYKCHNLENFGYLDYVDGNFDCYSNRLTTLKGSPKIVKGDFLCNDNELTSLKGAPKEVNGNFDCSNNNLTSLEGAPEIVKGGFDCYGNDNKFTKEEVRAVCNVKGKIYC